MSDRSSTRRDPKAPPVDPATAKAKALDPNFNARDQAIQNHLVRRYFTAGGSAIGVPVTTGANSKAIAFTRTEADALFGVAVTPIWITTWAIAASDKSKTGFTVHFGTVAPAGATIDFSTYRAG